MTNDVKLMQEHLDKCLDASQSGKVYSAEMTYKGLKLLIQCVKQGEYRVKYRYAVVWGWFGTQQRYINVPNWGNAESTMAIIDEHWV